ncbi:MAG: 30S ribosomal protein S15 [Nanobdellota archaeon]
MAKRFSRSRGKSGSSKVLDGKKPVWMTHKPKEAEMLVVKLAKEGYSSSGIGITLRDKYGIPSIKAITGKSITKIMEDKEVVPKLPEDLMNLMRKALSIRDHLEENHTDMTAKRGLELTEAKIRRLVGYYKEEGKISKDWKYNPKDARLYVE